MKMAVISASVLNLTMVNSSSSTDMQTNCDSFEWNGEVYTESGGYTFSALNSVGCDSTAILNLFAINASSISSEVVLACDSYQWNGEVYHRKRKLTLIHTLNSLGCDSVATLNLTINSSSNSSEDIVACDSCQWNGEVYYESGTYAYSTLNSLGCDSIANLNLLQSQVQVHLLRTLLHAIYTNGMGKFTQSQESTLSHYSILRDVILLLA